MARSLGIETVGAYIAAIIAIGALTLAVENRFALASDFERYQAITHKTHLEWEITRYQDKLEDLDSIPEGTLVVWQEVERARLLIRIERLVREVENYDGAGAVN